MFDSFFSTSSCNEVMPACNMRPNILYGSSAVDNPYNTHFLGGTTMMPRLTQDVYTGVKTEEYKNHKGLKNIAIGTGILIVGSMIFGKFRKLGKGFSGLFGSK